MSPPPCLDGIVDEGALVGRPCAVGVVRDLAAADRCFAEHKHDEHEGGQADQCARDSVEASYAESITQLVLH